jgi:hypothetical protein
LNQPIGVLPKLEKFQIKYGYEVFESRNNFPYRNFLIFETEVELKSEEDSRVWNSIEFDWILIELSDLVKFRPKTPVCTGMIDHLWKEVWCFKLGVSLLP